jgi:hypothetical protein
MYSIPQVLHTFRCSPTRSSCICTIGFFAFDAILDRLWTLWLRSESGGCLEPADFPCCLNKENVGRLFWTAGGELQGGGEDGGLDRDVPSEKIAGVLFGLEVGGGDVLRSRDEKMGSEVVSDGTIKSDLVSSTVSATRLRLAGGSSL